MNRKELLKIIKEGSTKQLEGGDTKHAFLLEHDGKKYVLRKFEDKETTEYYVKMCKKLHKYGFLPMIYGKNEEKALFEYIEGRDCNRDDAINVATQVGRICAIINKLKNLKPYDIDERFFSYISTLKEEKLIDEKKSSEIKNLYLYLKKKTKAKVIMDANDVYPENFRLSNGKVYLVDIEMMKPLFKGHGIAKAFIKWFKKDDERKEFKEGYKSIASIDFLTDDYLKFLYLNYFMRSIAIKIRLKIKLSPQELNRLSLLLEGKSL